MVIVIPAAVVVMILAAVVTVITAVIAGAVTGTITGAIAGAFTGAGAAWIAISVIAAGVLIAGRALARCLLARVGAVAGAAAEIVAAAVVIDRAAVIVLADGFRRQAQSGLNGTRRCRGAVDDCWRGHCEAAACQKVSNGDAILRCFTDHLPSPKVNKSLTAGILILADR